MTQRVLPIALIAVGTIWLLNAVGFVPPSLAAALGRLWPLLLIGGGLDLLVPRYRPRNVPFVALAAGAIVVLALFWPAGASRGDAEVHRELSPQTRRVTFDLDLGAHATHVAPAASASTLVRASFAGEPVGRVDVRDGAEASVRIRPERETFMTLGPRGRWALEVPRAVPLDLAVDAGSGPVTLDLVGTQLASLELDAGSGSVVLDLPGGGEPYAVDIDGGSGALEARVAPGASLDMRADLGSGAASVFVGEGSDARVVLRLGSGPLDLDLPDSAPIRLTVEDDGSGPLRLPSFLERRSGRGDTGVWESASLRDGGRVIEVVLERVGSGRVTVR